MQQVSRRTAPPPRTSKQPATRLIKADAGPAQIAEGRLISVGKVLVEMDRIAPDEMIPWSRTS
jgi:hypothetical protein